VMHPNNTVGIGVTQPVASLHVAGKFLGSAGSPATLSAGVLLGMDPITNNNARLCICAGASNAASQLDFSFAGQVTTAAMGSASGTTTAQARIALFHTSGLLSFFTKQSGNPVMTLDGSTTNQTVLINTSTSTATQPYRLVVTGSTYLNGSLTLPSTSGGTIACYSISTVVSKAFDVCHPTREGWRLRHRCPESDKARLFYEYTLECQLGLNTMQLPDWHQAMNSECRVYCAPFRHFGAAWGEVVGDELQITTNAPGAFHVYLTGVRCDAPAVEEWDRYGVEYPDASPGESAP